MLYVYEQQKCNQAWDSDNSGDTWEILGGGRELDLGLEDDAQFGEAGSPHCGMCDVGSEEPHFLLHILHGQLLEVAGLVSGPEMLASVWSNLPQEILERILAFLPAASQFRFCVVSKGWRSRFRSSRFNQLQADVERVRKPLVCAMEYQPGRLGRCAPRPSDISYLCKSRGVQVLKPGLSFLPLEFQLLSARDFSLSDGLICILKPLIRYRETVTRESSPECSSHSGFSGADDSAESDSSHSSRGRCADKCETKERVRAMRIGDLEGLSMSYLDGFPVVGMSFCVVNPLTKTWKVLPTENGLSEEFVKERGKVCWTVKVEVEKDGSGHFKVLVFNSRHSKGGRGERTREAVATIYSSVSNSWSVVLLKNSNGPRQYDSEDGGPSWPQYVVDKGLLFTADETDVMVHSLDTGEIVNCHNLRESIDPDYIGLLDEAHEDLGDVLMVFEVHGTIFCLQQAFSSEFGVWKLDTESLFFESFSTLPADIHESMFTPVKSKKRRRKTPKRKNLELYLIDAVQAGDLVCLTVGVARKGEEDKEALWKHLLTYHVLDATWSLIGRGFEPRRSSNPFYILGPSFELLAE